MGKDAAYAGALPAGLPCGRRAPRGRARWYLVRVPEGRERELCAKVRRAVAAPLLADAFALRRERWFKRAGAWSLVPVDMFKGYFFAVTADAAALDAVLARLTLPARVAGGPGRGFRPLAPEAQAWFEAAMDADHVLRNSTAAIVDGVLQVHDGPLVGQERRVRRIDRHRRRCVVEVCDADGGFAQHMALDVPFKS